MAMVMRARNSSRVLVTCLMPYAVLSKVWATSLARRPCSADMAAAIASVCVIRLGKEIRLTPENMENLPYFRFTPQTGKWEWYT